MWKLQVRPPHVGIEEKQPRKVHRAVAAEDLILIQFEVDPEPLDDLLVGSGLNLQADGVPLAAVVEFHADGFQQRAGFLLLEIQV